MWIHDNALNKSRHVIVHEEFNYVITCTDFPKWYALGRRKESKTGTTRKPARDGRCVSQANSLYSSQDQKNSTTWLVHHHRPWTSVTVKTDDNVRVTCAVFCTTGKLLRPIHEPFFSEYLRAFSSLPAYGVRAASFWLPSSRYCVDTQEKIPRATKILTDP